MQTSCASQNTETTFLRYCISKLCSKFIKVPRNIPWLEYQVTCRLLFQNLNKIGFHHYCFLTIFQNIQNFQDGCFYIAILDGCSSEFTYDNSRVNIGHKHEDTQSFRRLYSKRFFDMFFRILYLSRLASVNSVFQIVDLQSPNPQIHGLATCKLTVSQLVTRNFNPFRPMFVLWVNQVVFYLIGIYSMKG